MRKTIKGFVKIASSESMTCLKAYLEATGLQQDELATAAEVHRNTVGAAAAGSAVRRTTAAKLSEFTGLPEDLIYAAVRRHEWQFNVNGSRVELIGDDAIAA